MIPTTNQQLTLKMADTKRFDDLLFQINVILKQHSVKNWEDFDFRPVLELCSELTNGYDESHDVYHHVNVFRTAIKIAVHFCWVDARDPLLRWVFYATLLHDTIDHKYPNDIDVKRKKLEDFVLNISPVQSDYLPVLWIIDNISYSKEVKNGYPIHTNFEIQLARNIVSDADKIDALGHVGIQRCKQFAKEKNPGLSEEEITKLVVEHCHEKLLKLKDNYIRTFVGKELAKEGHDIIQQFVDSYGTKK